MKAYLHKSLTPFLKLVAAIFQFISCLFQRVHLHSQQKKRKSGIF